MLGRSATGGGDMSPLVPVVARSNARVYALSPAWIAGSNPAKDMDACLLGLLNVVR